LGVQNLSELRGATGDQVLVSLPELDLPRKLNRHNMNVEDQTYAREFGEFFQFQGGLPKAKHKQKIPKCHSA